MNSFARVLLVALSVSGCGGNDEPPPIELAIDAPAQAVNNQVVLRGTSFVPPGSSCPQTADFIRIGSLGAHQIAYTNRTTGASGPAFADLWVCNSEEGRRIHWTSGPIALVRGNNEVSVTMTASGRSSSASIVLAGQG